MRSHGSRVVDDVVAFYRYYVGRDPTLVFAPKLELDAATRARFDSVLEDLVDRPGVALADEALDAPKHLFFRYLAEERGFLLHGSNRADIEVFEPRVQTDATQNTITAVFAASDGIWPLFFAVIDRTDEATVSLINGCFTLEADDPRGPRGYFFSVGEAALAGHPFCDGTIYVLVREGFSPAPGYDGKPTQEWSCAHPVTPIARVRVTPADFPYLASIEGHDQSGLSR
jgi:hypothetical protein